MSTTALNIPLPGARTKAATPGLWLRLWAALERHGRRRAATELRRIAAMHDFSDPALTRQLLDTAAGAERG
jgi:hypothetical protein